MKKIIVMFTGVFLFLFCTMPVVAADNYGIWTSAGIRKDFHKWKFELNEEFRFSNAAPSLGRYFTEISAGYSVADWFSLDAGYRFAQDRDKNNAWRTLHRFVVDAELSKDVARMEFSYRLRYTNEDDFVSGGNDASSFLRQKVKAEYHIRNSAWDPYFSGELYYQLPDGKSGEFNKVRYTLGTQLSLNKKNRFGLFLRLQHEFNVSKPDRDFITGLSYMHRL
jgi:hypothetical protein